VSATEANTGLRKPDNRDGTLGKKLGARIKGGKKGVDRVLSWGRSIRSSGEEVKRDRLKLRASPQQGTGKN